MPAHFSSLYSSLVLLLSTLAIASSWVTVGGSESEDQFFNLWNLLLIYLYGHSYSYLSLHRCFFASHHLKVPSIHFYFLVLTLYSRFLSGGSIVLAIIMTLEVMS